VNKYIIKQIFISVFKKKRRQVITEKDTWLQIHRRAYNWEKAGDWWDASRVCNNCVTSFLLSFRAWIPACFTVNYKHPCWSLVLQFAFPCVNQIRVNQSECKRLRLLPCGFNAGEIHDLIYRAFSFKPRVSSLLHRDTARCATRYMRLQAI